MAEGQQEPGRGETPPEDTGGETPPEQQEPRAPSGDLSAQADPILEALQTELTTTQAALKRVNAESAKRRKQLEAHEVAETKRKEAELSEVEKAQKAAQEWEEKHKSLTAKLDAAQRGHNGLCRPNGSPGIYGTGFSEFLQCTSGGRAGGGGSLTRDV